MGNCCGGQSKDDNFQGEGRTLGASPANAPPRTDNARAAAPPPKISSSAPANRTVGGGGSSDDPRAAAARAAEERAKASQATTGKLGKDLQSQKSQTVNAALGQNARDNLAARDADTAAQVRNYE